MRQGISARHGAGRQVAAQVSPWLQVWCKASGQSGNVEQHRFAALLNRKVAQSGGIHARRTEKLRGGAEMVEIIGILSETKSDPDILVADPL